MTEARCREIVAARSGGRCERCGRYRAESMHHRRKRSHGGPWAPSNVVHLCGDGTTGCHGWIEHHAAKAEVEGFHVPSWEDEREVPLTVSTFPALPVLLDDEGLLIPFHGKRVES